MMVCGGVVYWVDVDQCHHGEAVGVMECVLHLGGGPNRTEDVHLHPLESNDELSSSLVQRPIDPPAYRDDGEE